MSHVYIVINTSDNKIFSIENEIKPTPLEWQKVIHWVTENSGGTPKVGDILNDTRTRAEKRRDAYEMELDKLWIEYQGNLEDGDNEISAKIPWSNKRAEIKALYP